MDSIRVTLIMPQPFTGDVKILNTLLDRNGRFEFYVNPEVNQARVAISTDINPLHSVTMFLKNDHDNMVSFSYNGEGDIDKLKTKAAVKKGGNIAAEMGRTIVNTGDDPVFTEKELINANSKFNEILSSVGPPLPALYDKPFSHMVDTAIERMELRRLQLNHSSYLSDRMKDILFTDFKITKYLFFFDYEETMKRNYSHNNNGNYPDSGLIKSPVLKDYGFLKKLDLNNPTYLHTYTFLTLMQTMLEDKVLNIPRIHETPIEEWLNNAKAILGELVGFKEGPFYDVLVGNAYGNQFEVELKPLTPVQIEQIKRYYKGSDMEQVLLRRNEEIRQILAATSPLVINTTPDVPKEELIDAIVAKYKGKTVVVDFWATWCQPCMLALTWSRDLKMQLKGKDVVFVYITTDSSPKKLWERHIEGIRGEQYYIAREQWDFLLDSHKSPHVPAYEIYDRKGEKKHELIGYPGNESMQKMIEELL